jgi:ribonuclease P protein component
VVRVHRAAPVAQVANARLGIVVAKKLVRTSVRRNEAKRQIRESFRLISSHVRPGDYVVRVVSTDRTITVKAWGQHLRVELDGLWAKFKRVSEARA